MSQNGRRRCDSGHGSRAIGASGVRGFGMPGLSGECISLSKRFIPPVADPSTGKVGAPGGVGKGWDALPNLVRPYPDMVENVVLIGVETDRSDPSGLDTETLFKLREDLFFLSGGAMRFALVGDGGRILPYSAAPATSGVAGEMVT